METRNNFLIRRPIRVVWIGAPEQSREDDHKEIASNIQGHTFCFMGSEGIPRYIRDELARVSASIKMNGINSKQTKEICESKKMRDYFDPTRGETVASILGIDLPKKVGAFRAPAMSPTSRDNMSLVTMSRAGSKARRGRPPATPLGDDLDDDVALIEKMIADEEEKKTTDTEVARGTTFAHIDRPPQFPPGELTIVPDVQMFPEDSFADIKRKIFAVTHIPIYRQHVVAGYMHDRTGKDAGGTLTTSYNLYTMGQHVIDFRDLYKPNIQSATDRTLSLFGIPIDRAIYDTRDDVRVEARDHVTMIEQLKPDFFVVIDISNWIVPNIEQIRSAISDNYQFELLYYGFVVKYFPQLTRECFFSYVANEGELEDRFPDLAPAWTTVHDAVIAQCHISNATYASQTGARGGISEHNIDHIIMRASVGSHAPGVPIKPINLRDFFDSIVCSRTILDVRALIEGPPSQYNRRESFRYDLRKFYKYSELTSAVAGSLWHSVGPCPGASRDAQSCNYDPHSTGRIPSLGGEQGIIITFMFNNMPMFVIVRASGRVSFQFQWREEDEIDFGTMAALFRKHTAYFIDEMRKTGVSISADIDPVTESNMRIQSLTVAARWKHTINSKQFRLLCEAWGDYIRAGIIIPRQTTKDQYSFVFTRGIVATDTQQFEQRLAALGIAETNHYAYMSVSAIRQKWIQNFAGRIVSISHRATDVRFDVRDIYESEYYIFEMYLSRFIANFENTNDIRSTGNDQEKILEASIAHNGEPSRRRLRRLQEIDPVLYNLKKYGAPRVYSTRCQCGKQPILYSEREVRRKMVPKDAVKYWNFTTRKPAFYSCPNTKYPYLNFIVNIHPKGYCIPCCGKLQPSQGSRHAQIEKICIADHSYDANKLIEQPTSYIMSFGKDLPEGRLSHLPTGYLRDTFNRAVSAAHHGAMMLIYGVPQDIGIIHAIRAILNMSVKDFTDKIVRGIESGAIGFETIAGGRAATYFTSKNAFAGFIARIAHGHEYFPEGTTEFMRVVITDCVRAVFNLEMVYLSSSSQGGSIIISKVPRLSSALQGEEDAERPMGFAVIDPSNGINPVMTIHPDDFTRDGSIVSRIVLPECKNIIMQIARGYDEHKMKNIDLSFMREFCAREALGIQTGGSASPSKKPSKTSIAFRIHKLYIGLRGLCYAVLLQEYDDSRHTGLDFAYIPIAYSNAQKQRIAERRDEEVGFDSIDDKVKSSACISAIGEINDYIAHNKLSYYKLVIENAISVESKPIGFIVRTGIRAISYFNIDDIGIDRTTTPNARAVKTMSIDPRKHARMLLAESQRSAEETDTSHPVKSDKMIATSAQSRISKYAADQMYPYYEYEMFCVQFMARVATMKNDAVRKQIIDIIERKGERATSDEKREALRNLDMSRHDFMIIADLMGVRSKKTVRDQLENIHLDADLTDLYHNIETLDIGALAQWVKKFMEPVIFQAPSTSAEFNEARVPPIIVPCSHNMSLAEHDHDTTAHNHCTDDGKGKLIIKTAIDTLTSIIASDLQNPLKRAYIFARGYVPESRASFADFTQRSGEVLLVKKYESSQ